MPSYINGRTLGERVFSRLVIDPSGCLLWTGTKTPNGYGQITVAGAKRSVHRVVYELLVGPIPDGLHVDHLCRVRHCANVAHLDPVTCQENLRRGDTFAARTHCPQGHPYDEANTYRWRGERHCRSCGRLRAKRTYDRKKAAA